MDNETKPQESQQAGNSSTAERLVEVPAADVGSSPTASTISPPTAADLTLNGKIKKCGRCWKPKWSADHAKEPICECGIPPKFTRETVNKLEEAFAVGANVTQACFYADISRKTYYQWLEDNPELGDRFLAIQEKMPLKAKENIARSVHAGNVTDSWRVLERKEPDNYAEVLKHQHSGSIGNEQPALEDDEDPEVKAARENLISKRRAARQRRAVERDARLKELQTEKAKQNGQNANSGSGNQLVDNNSGGNAGDRNVQPPVVAGNPADGVK